MTTSLATSKPLQLSLGLLFSRSGSYGEMGVLITEGVLLAVEEINSSQDRLQIDVVTTDPKGIPMSYTAACANLRSSHGVQHFLGCYTSAARKWVLPWLERNDALLWHPARYEGFEADQNVIYVGGAPNHHIVPLAQYMLRAIGSHVYCIGTDYVWTWETNRVLRDIVTAASGKVVAERLVPFGALDLAGFIRDILSKRPDAVFSTLVGDSSYQFFQLWAAATKGLSDPPVILSCSICEAELKIIGPKIAAGCISSATYFESVETPANKRFLKRFRARYGTQRLAFSDLEAAYTATHLLARATLRAGTIDPVSVRAAAMLDKFDAPQGLVHLDPATNHCYLTPRLGRAQADCSFEIIEEASMPVRPDPFLARLNTQSQVLPHLPSRQHNHNRNVEYLRVVK